MTLVGSDNLSYSDGSLASGVCYWTDVLCWCHPLMPRSAIYTLYSSKTMQQHKIHGTERHPFPIICSRLRQRFIVRGLLCIERILNLQPLTDLNIVDSLEDERNNSENGKETQIRRKTQTSATQVAVQIGQFLSGGIAGYLGLELGTTSNIANAYLDGSTIPCCYDLPDQGESSRPVVILPSHPAIPRWGRSVLLLKPCNLHCRRGKHLIPPRTLVHHHHHHHGQPDYRTIGANNSKPPRSLVSASSPSSSSSRA